MDTDVEEAPLPILSVGARVRDLLAALVCGQIAGLVMLLTMLIVSDVRGLGVSYPLRAIGSILYLSPNLQPGAGPLVLGFLAHQFGFSVFWSLIYDAFVRRTDRKNVWRVIAIGLGGHWGTAALGPLVGMAAQIVDVMVVMPNIAQQAEWTHLFIGLWSWLYHFVFGLGLATFPWVRRWMFR